MFATYGMKMSLGLALLASAAGVADAGTFRAGAGVDYTTGEYGGSESIAQTYVPVSAAYRSGRWGMRLTVPYVSVDGPGTVIDSGGEFIAGPDESRGGLGDVIVSGTLYDVLRDDTARFFLDLTAKAKLGTASEADGLGTGENDYSLQLDALKEFGRVGLFATAGYKLRGDPEGTDLRNTAFGTVGADYRIGSDTRVGLLLDYRPSAIRGGDALREATMFLSFRPSASATVQPYLVSGFSDSSPDWGGGVSIVWRHAP